MATTPKGLHSKAQGRRFGAPWVMDVGNASSTPKGLHNVRLYETPLGYRRVLPLPTQGAPSRPWALKCNPFGVNACVIPNLKGSGHDLDPHHRRTQPTHRRIHHFVGRSGAPTPIRNRIKCHRKVRAADLVPHEWNFRVQPATDPRSAKTSPNPASVSGANPCASTSCGRLRSRPW